MTFRIEDKNFVSNNRKTFLNSGEIHYFRIKREYWEKHLQAAREAGLKTVSSYVPWAWHEPEEGFFDFKGDSLPERDLVGWLELCKAHGLTCIVKPGPFILAEFRGAGLPDWFLDNNGTSVRMHNSRGEAVSSEGVSLFHPAYLQNLTLWYDQVLPLISGYEMRAGGPVILMQICNEIGLFSWLAHQADYSGPVRGRFRQYLKNRFSSVQQMNELWGTDFDSFDQIELPPDGNLPYESRGDRSRDHEWHRFWRTYYGEYLRMLIRMARDRGITVPVYHNLPGWIYGHGYEFPVNITMYQDLYGEKSELSFGVDHIPEFLSYRNMHDDRIINDITSATQGNKHLFAAEFQSGSREYHVVTNPREMELFYKASISNGIMGWNYYMFSQGRNPERKGYSGDTFYWFTPLTAEGEKSNAFPLVKRMSRIVDFMENLIVEARRRAEICVLFYPPYYASELERPETGASALSFVPSAIRRPAYFDGLLKVLQLLNVDYDMADLSQVEAAGLEKYKQVWAFATDEMDAREQQVLMNYTKAGGHLVIFPHLPDREMSQNPCTILRDAISIKPSGKFVIDSPLIDVLGLRDIKCANPQMVFDENTLSNAKIIARTLSGAPCGFEKNLGKGKMLHLGTWLGFDTEGHKPVYKALLEKSGARISNAFTSNDDLSVRQRFTPQSSSVLFVGNYYNEAKTGHVTYSHPKSGERINIPFSGEKTIWPPLYGILCPVGLEIITGLELLHCTSDILNVAVEDGLIEITLFGERDLLGEMVFEGVQVERIIKASLNDEVLDSILVQDRYVLNYKHHHQQEMVLKIKLA
ncbi:MAG: beta-galactosidase [Bacteroides sp.]|jgi:beta-galactosidase|nr:beta-galactosidase [Bacteroides sp.]